MLTINRPAEGLSFGTLFSGIGGSSLGAKATGLKEVFSVERDPAIASIHRLNGGQPTVADVTSFHPALAADILLASPPCVNFSGANVGAQESEQDFNLALAIARIALGSGSKIVIIENVASYFKGKAFRGLVKQIHLPLQQVFKINAADYCFQNRRRSFAVFSRLSVDFELSAAKLPSYPDLSQYASTATPAEYTKPQFQKLDGLDVAHCIIQRCGYRKTPIYRVPGEPIPTNRSHQWHDGKGSFRQALNLIYNGRCYEMPTGLLLELSGFPVKFDLGITDKASKITAMIGLGNVVHPPVIESLIRQVISVTAAS
jgi:hypothetical protein